MPAPSPLVTAAAVARAKVFNTLGVQVISVTVDPSSPSETFTVKVALALNAPSET